MTTTDVLPRWSSGVPTEADHDRVLELFGEPDFYFRTYRPDTLAEWEVLGLLDEDTRVLYADGEPVGLYTLEAAGLPHGCHFSLELRLRAAAPLSWWVAAYQEIVRAVRWRQELIRLALRFAEFDTRGLRAARAIGLADEGTLPEVLVHDGRRCGQVFFSQIWMP